MNSREEIYKRIAAEKARIKGLNAEILRAKRKIASLERSLENDDVGPVEIPAPTPMTGTEKVRLFLSLFRGRDDVFAVRWENPKSGRSGYSPACANEWDRHLCEKKIRTAGNGRKSCGQCEHRAFHHLSEEQVERHLRGETTIGVYPLLPDDTCRFLAIDFDKSDWRVDVQAFRETCNEFGIDVAVERSRSGNGAHVWFFFNSPLKASAARSFGSLLIQRTIEKRPQLSLDSFDRLFPSQDTMPKGGFGNLIALPLQREARREGNSVFLDLELTPVSDQWAYLSALKRMTPEEVEKAIAALSAEKTSLVTESDRSYDCADLSHPENVAVTMTSMLELSKTGLSPALIQQIRKLAVFPNPEFFKRQSLRLSTAMIPRYINCSDEMSDRIVIPRGCEDELRELLGRHGISLDLSDMRNQGTGVDLAFQGTLSSVQLQAIDDLLAYDAGVLVAPPGAGKTVIGIRMIAERRVNTLVIVHRKVLLEQWINRLATFLAIDPKEIGQIGGGKNRANGRLDVAMVQSLIRNNAVSEQITRYGHIILDECHHCPAVSFERVLAHAPARYILGLTATPKRRDGLHPILYMQVGPVRHTISTKYAQNDNSFSAYFVLRRTGFSLDNLQTDLGIQQIYSRLVEDEKRNDLIFDDVMHSLDEGRSPILLTERRDHLEYFADRCNAFTKHLVVLHGGIGKKQREAAATQLASIPEDEERLIIATGKYIGEGFDDARLDTLFLALPVSWRGTLIQYAGRLHRLHPGKSDVRIYDYVDESVEMLEKMAEKRLKGYRAMGYEEIANDSI